jgi:hypothetical protein
MGRVKRGPGPRQRLRAHNYRRLALPFLLKDFQERCAYSMQHSSRVGMKTMEVDHFNPRLPNRLRHRYTNLFLATRHCNGAKGENWPTRAQMDRGISFLDCCQEQDYGVHIFENAETHRVYGASAAGRYHIRMCDLNAPHFVRERRQRSELNKILTSSPAIIRDLGRALELVNLLRLLTDIGEKMIPPIATNQP